MPFPPLNALDYIDVSLHDAIRDFTSTEDVTSQLQQFFDDVSIERKKGRIPSGKYNISAPVWVVRTKDQGDFYTSNIEGDGSGYVELISQTLISAHHVDGPALMIQRGRGVRMSGICIQGENRFTNPPFPSPNQADYLAMGVRADANSPHCGIAIDPTLGTIPAPAKKYPGLIDEYKGDVGGSKNIWLTDIAARGFAVGIVVSPQASSVQAEMVTIRDSHVGACDIGISYGQPQSRANSIYTTDLEFCRIAVTTAENGQINGSLQNVEGCQFVQCFFGFTGNTNKGVNAFNNCYYEAVTELAKYGSGFGQIKSPLVFNSCEFRIVPENGRYWPTIARANSPVVFNQCFFTDNSVQYVKAMNFGATHNFANFEFNGCQFWGAWAVNEQAVIGCQRGNTFTTPQFGNSVFKNCWTMSNEDNNPYRIADSTAAYTSVQVTLSEEKIFDVSTVTFECLNQTEVDKVFLGQLIFWEVNNMALPAIEVTTISGLTVTGSLLFDKFYYNEDPPWIAGFWFDAIVTPRSDMNLLD